MPYLTTSPRFASTAAPFDPFSVGWHAAVWANDPDWANPGDGVAVSTWRDGSGNARTPVQATGANQPIFRSSVALLNNRSAVDFDGVDDILASAGFTSQSNPTLVWIGKRDGTGGGGGERLIDVASGPTWTSLFMSSSNGKWEMYGSATLTSTVSHDATAGHAIRARFTGGANTAITVDGVATTGTGGTAEAVRFFVGGASTLEGLANIHTAFAGVYVGDVTADANWAAFVTWVSTYYALTIS